MSMENEQFEDVFPIEDGDFPASHVSLPECIEIGKGSFCPKIGSFSAPQSFYLLIIF